MSPGRSQERWSRGADLNRRPADYESAALPTELPRLNHFNLALTARSVKPQAALEESLLTWYPPNEAEMNSSVAVGRTPRPAEGGGAGRRAPLLLASRSRHNSATTRRTTETRE